MDPVNNDVDLENDGNIFDTLNEINNRWICNIAENISVHNFMNFKQFLMCFDDTINNIFKY